MPSTTPMQILSNLKGLLRYWKPLLVVLLGVLALRLLPDSVVRVEPDSTGEPARRREPAPFEQRQSAPGAAAAVAVGERFESLDQLTAAQAASGYLRIGTFGEGWPATVAEVLRHDDAISFTRKDGSRHNYTGFDGYRMQVVRLSGPAASEVLVVFRSAARR